MKTMTLNIRGRLLDLSTPKVMGIVNVTPDSFYASGRTPDTEAVERRILQLRDEGADIIDIGGCSTRPGAEDVTPEEEYSRLSVALEVIHRLWQEVPVSVDTYRAEVARRCVEEWGVDIINDVAGGTLDPEMWKTVAELRVAYVLMHMRGTPATMQTFTDYTDVTAKVITDLSRKVFELRGLGVNDIIIDPGFGFAKTVEQNFILLEELDEFCKMGMPVLAGLSRKSMIWRSLGITPEESLEGTVALNAIALQKGASLLRVHDVKAAKEVVKLHMCMEKARKAIREL
ncbi:MAG: dihydropteroate synthase [Muribaculaceae bacterium]|nr:dihydropteroate synthase [Muribaculaceae bacterium]